MDGNKHGEGTYTTPDPYLGGILSKYVGSYVDGKRHGEGIYIDKDDLKFVGSWVHGARHGEGTITDGDGDDIWDCKWSESESDSNTSDKSSSVSSVESW